MKFQLNYSVKIFNKSDLLINQEESTININK